MFRRKRLAPEINIRSQVDDLPDGPAQSNPDNAAENPHGACFREEKSLYVGIAGPDSFHNANFAAALEDSHDQRVYNPDESDGQREAAEDSEKDVQHFKELLYAAAGINDRKGVEAHFLDGVFHLLHLARIFHSYIHRGIDRLIAGRPGNFA